MPFEKPERRILDDDRLRAAVIVVQDLRGRSPALAGHRRAQREILRYLERLPRIGCRIDQDRVAVLGGSVGRFKLRIRSTGALKRESRRSPPY